MSSTSLDSSPDLSAVLAPASTISAEPPAKVRREYNLPLTPVITIKPTKAWLPLNLHHLWTSRELLYFLMWRDVKVRYKQTLLGALWAILQPLVMMIIFAIFFGRLARMPTQGVPSPLFYYAGMSLWTFFSNSIMNGANSLFGNTNLITKIYFPRLLIPSAAIGAGILDWAIAWLLFIPLLAYYGVGITWKLALILPVSVLIIALALATGILFSALNVKYRDVRYVLPFLLQAWMFLSPIIYDSSIVPPEWRRVFLLNPMTGIVNTYRATLFGQWINWWAIGYSTLLTFLLLSVSVYAFRRMEKSFAELI
jgi:lipopolysaccharide transport system permease protein